MTKISEWIMRFNMKIQVVADSSANLNNISKEDFQSVPLHIMVAGKDFVDDTIFTYTVSGNKVTITAVAMGTAYLHADIGGKDSTLSASLKVEVTKNYNYPTSVNVASYTEIVYDETEGVHWIEYDAVLWTKYSFKAIKKLLNSKRKKVSVEIECIDSYIRDDGIEEIVEFNYLGTTILSDKLGCGVPNAHLTILELMEDSLFQRKQKCLAFAYSALDEKMKNDNNVSAKTKKNKKVEIASNIENVENVKVNIVETPTTENVEMDSNINDKFSSEGTNFEEIC